RGGGTTIARGRPAERRPSPSPRPPGVVPPLLGRGRGGALWGYVHRDPIAAAREREPRLKLLKPSCAEVGNVRSSAGAARSGSWSGIEVGSRPIVLKKSAARSWRGMVMLQAGPWG